MVANLAADAAASGKDRRASGVVWPILRLAAPLTAFFFVQSATSLASLAMLGRVGDTALAGVGAASAVYGVVLALMFGIDAAVQAMVSRTTGAGRNDRLGQVLIDAQALALPLGGVLAAALWFLGGPILRAMLPDAAASAAGAGFIKAAAPSLVSFAVTIPVNACWIGSGRPGRAFLVTLALAPAQIAATFALVFGWGWFPALGAAGAGAAISLATFAGVALQLSLALHRQAIPGYLRAAPRLSGMAAIAAIGWPISLQQSFGQLGLMVAFVIVGRLGTVSVAAINVLISLTTVAVQLAVGFGTAAATLVGQTLGRGDIAEARRWGWRTAGLGVAVTGPLGIAALAAPHALLSLFLHDPATLAIAEWPARLLGLGVAADTAGRILCFAIRGAGATRIGAGIPFVALWLIQLPLTWWLAVILGFGVLGMTSLQFGVAFAEAVVTALVWAGARWTAPGRLSQR
jgi:multidrug resistance protein, MATE family